MSYLRQPAVAGRFYSDRPQGLRSTVERHLRAARSLSCDPAALIVPHAGYVYSGPVAAAGYACLPPDRCRALRRVVLLGTAHAPGAAGLLASRAEAFLTPLGPVRLDRPAVEQLLGLPQVTVDEAAHARDHSLEVQLPFLQVLAPGCAVVPLLVGRCDPGEVAEVLERLWRPEDGLVVVSSDLSHGLDADTARDRDRRTAEAIRTLQVAAVGPEQACGYHAIRGLLEFAGRRGWRVSVAELKNSGDTAGPRDRVVGYGAFLFTEAPGRRGGDR